MPKGTRKLGGDKYNRELQTYFEIQDRDRRDIQEVEDRSPTRITLAGRTITTLPPKIPGGTTRLQRMAAADAIEREDRRGVIYGGRDTNKTGKGWDAKEGDETRARLRKMYEKQAPKKKK